MTAGDGNEAPLPFGVSATTGRLLNGLSDATIASLLGQPHEPSATAAALAGRSEPSGSSFAVEGGIDANDLAQVGWGVIYGPGVDKSIKDALQPLLDHRKAQADPFKIF